MITDSCQRQEMLNFVEFTLRMIDDREWVTAHNHADFRAELKRLPRHLRDPWRVQRKAARLPLVDYVTALIPFEPRCLDWLAAVEREQLG